MQTHGASSIMRNVKDRILTNIARKKQTGSTRKLDAVGHARNLRPELEVARKSQASIVRAERGKQIALIRSQGLKMEPLAVDQELEVPFLANGLDRVLFSPGIHMLKDPRTNVYNFSSQLEDIMSIRDFDFDRIAPFVPPDKDSILAKLARKHGLKYVSSTSSLTGILSHLHYAISHMRPPHTLNLSKYIPEALTTFSAAQRSPLSVFLKLDEESGVFSISSNSDQDPFILSLLGHELEAMLTTDINNFKKFNRNAPDFEAFEGPPTQHSYHFTTCGPILMRSQLDCYDSRLPGTGMFDLKTRAVCAVRHDIDYAQINEGSGYQLNRLHGRFESYSREQLELIRSAMFKYSLQARIGRMDGIFIAYHNVRTLFGFEYVPLSELDKIYHTAHLVDNATSKLDVDAAMSTIATNIAEAEFLLSVNVATYIFEDVLTAFKSRSTKLELVFYCPSPETIIVLAKDVHKGSNLLPPQPWLPEDVVALRYTVASYVDGKLVPFASYPSPYSSGSWDVSLRVETLNGSEAASIYSQTMGAYTANEISSSPLLDRIADEEEWRRKMLSQLPKPSKLQTQLRRLGVRGEASRVLNASREKIEWRASNA